MQGAPATTAWPHGPCPLPPVAVQWDPSGEQLAMIPAGNTQVFLWSAVSKEVTKIDSEFKVIRRCSSFMQAAAIARSAADTAD